MIRQGELDLEERVGEDDGEEDGYDAVVVGSGYGGSVAAFRMSMAGIKVCLLEKGKRWEAQDFPTDSLKIMSNVRMENQKLGLRFGPEDALFQVIFCFFIYALRKHETMIKHNNTLENNMDT